MPVKGIAQVNISVNNLYWYRPLTEMNIASIIKEINLVDGKADLSISLKELMKLNSNVGYLTYTVNAKVTESATGVVLSGMNTVDSKVEKYFITFLDISPTNYKPGLVYIGYIQLSLADQSTPSLSDLKTSKGTFKKVSIRATCNLQDYTKTALIKKLDVLLNGNGFGSFTYSVVQGCTSVNFQADFYSEETNTTISAYFYASPFKTRDKESIQLSSINSNSGLKIGNAKFIVKSTKPISTFYYEVLGKGVVIISSFVIEEPSNEHRFSIDINQLTASKLAPNAKVIVWYLTDKGEIIADTLVLKVTDYFINKVSLSFNQTIAKPSGPIQITIKSSENSHVGILAIDRSVLLLGSGNDITQNTVITDLDEYDHSIGSLYSDEDPYNDNGIPDYGDIFPPMRPRFIKNPILPEIAIPQPIAVNRRKRRSINKFFCPWYINGENTYSLFENAGIFVLTNAYVERQQRFFPMLFMARNEAPMLMAMTDVGAPINADKESSSIPVRSNFPETWIWTEVETNENGLLSLKTIIPDTITSWVASAFAINDADGLGVTAVQTNITVLKPFFISLNLPYSIIRGEEFVLKVSVFNYLSSNQQVVVTLKNSTYFQARLCGSTNNYQNVSLTQSVKVAQNDVQTVYFWIVASSIGQIPIEVRAIAGTAIAGDAMIINLLVIPEGMVQRYSTSLFVKVSGSYSNEFNISLPSNILVPGSVYNEITVIGDIMGSSLNGLTDLLQMPGGCGEQNMLNFAPDIYILNYLTISGQLTVDISNKAIQFMTSGYQRQLIYQRNDGSFSAFGNSDPAGSVWLSSFVIKCFHQAIPYIPIDLNNIAKTIGWIVQQQNKSTSAFAEPEGGRVIHTDMQGGSSKGLALTAYVLIALLENTNVDLHNYVSNINDTISKTLILLESQYNSVSNDPYTLSIVSYAFFLAGSKEITNALSLLNKLAIIDGDFKYWKKPEDSTSSNMNTKFFYYQQSPSVDIEMTSYALLLYSLKKDLNNALPIAKWLMKQRNAFGGFASTQDTVVGLEALAEFSTLISFGADNYGINISISCKFPKFMYDFTSITKETALLLQSKQVPDNCSQISILGKGSGVAILQLNVKYNVIGIQPSENFVLNLKTTETGDSLNLNICTNWKGTEVTGMVILEINFLTGYSLQTTKEELTKQIGTILRREDSDKSKVVLYLDELTSSQICFSTVFSKEQIVKGVKDSSVKIYQYYNPGSANIQFYGIKESISKLDGSKQIDLCI